MSHKCKACGRMFRKTDHLRQHEKAAHPPKRRPDHSAFSRFPIIRGDVLGLTLAAHIASDMSHLQSDLNRFHPFSKGRIR